MKWNFKIITNKEAEQAAQELRILEDDVAAAHDFLRKNRKNYFQGKKKIPIYLILGPSRFGKTTILSRAGLDLIDANNQKLNNVSPTKYCSFWFTKDALYIDTAGTYTKPDISKPRNDLIWQGFIKLLQKYFGKNSIAGILIILDLPAITQDKNLLKKTLFCIRERIYEMTPLVKTMHTHIIFTKCDCILGFTEFFSLLNAEERLQPFGISFANNKKLDLIPTFEDKFNELLKQINNRVVENLQKSVRPKERSLIKIFPSQMDTLRQTFIEVISKIPNSHQIQLSGIYFTSSIQKGMPIDPIKTALLNVFNLKEKPAYNLEANDDRSYFVEDIFKKAIHLPKQNKPHPLSNSLKPHFIYLYALLVASLIISISSIIGYQNYHKNLTAMNQIELSLQSQNTDKLQNLHTTINLLEQSSNSWWLKLGINKTKSVYQALVKTHQVLFIKNLTSQLEGYLNTTLNSQEPVDAQKLYRALRVYLMFGNHNKLDQNYVKNWFDDYWIGLYNNQKNSSQQQLAAALQHKFRTTLNQPLIDAVRDNLNKLPQAQLIYILLENTYAGENLELNNKSISKIYTRENFNKIYDDSIPHLVNKLPKHDWVLGDLKLQLETDTNNDIIQSIREIYIEKYVATWENIIKQEPKIKSKNLRETAEYLNTISAANSPLIKLLQQIKHNTDIKNLPPKLNKEISNKLQELNSINILELKNILNNLAHYASAIAQNTDVSKSAFDALIKYSQNKQPQHPITSLKFFSDKQPPLLRSHLQSIANNVWQTLLNASYIYINQAWTQIIIPKYKETLANRYPLFKDSKEDINLNDFNDFFGLHGIVDDFFNQYIKPLINIDKNNWTWKSIDEQEINFPQEALEIFLRASLIQKMFYPYKMSNPKLRFTLTPVDMTPNTQSFTIHIDGQKISFNNEDKKNYSLVWPGPQPGLVTISFVNTQGKYFTASEFGPWAWFRILDKANVTSNNSTKLFELTFDLNGNAAKYTLSTTEPVNPFLSEIINNFRCPDQLESSQSS